MQDRVSISKETWILIILAGGFLWLAMLSPLGVPSEPQLDVSHGMTLGHMLKTGAQAGRDYAFTYGPFGYFASTIFIDELYVARIVWDLLFHLAAVFVLMRLTLQMPTRLLKVAHISAVLFLLPHTETLYLAAIVGAGIDLIMSDRWSVVSMALASAIWAALGLVKFTFFALGSATLVLTALGAPGPRRLRVALTLSTFFASWVVVAWTAAGQPPAGFVDFVRTSLELSNGYSESMITIGPEEHVIAAQEVMVFLAGAAALAAYSVISNHRRVVGLLLLAGSVFLAFKEGFVRQDLSHESIFFAFAAMSSLWVVLLTRGRDATPLQPALVVLALLGSLRSFCDARGELLRPNKWLPERIETAGHSVTRLPILSALRDSLREQVQQARPNFALPEIKKKVGRKTADIVSVDQVTLLMNDLNYRSRPVFQSYAAFTPTLAALNGNFFRHPTAPDFVIANWMPIDNRFLPHDDPASFLELIRRYRPVFIEREYLLLEKRPRRELSSSRGKMIVRRSLQFGQVLRLPSDTHRDTLMTLSLDFRYTEWGKARKFFFRAEPVSMAIDAHRRRVRYRILPRLARTEFLINPLVEWNYDLITLYDHDPKRYVRSIKISTTEAGKKMYEPEIIATVRVYPRPARATVLPIPSAD